MSESNSVPTAENDASNLKTADSLKEEANAYFKSKSINVIQVSRQIGCCRIVAKFEIRNNCTVLAEYGEEYFRTEDCYYIP